jgi:hypothetical protein
MGVRPDAPTIETIVPVAASGIINLDGFVKSPKMSHCEHSEAILYFLTH